MCIRQSYGHHEVKSGQLMMIGGTMLSSAWRSVSGRCKHAEEHADKHVGKERERERGQRERERDLALESDNLETEQNRTETALELETGWGCTRGVRPLNSTCHHQSTSGGHPLLFPAAKWLVAFLRVGIPPQNQNHSCVHRAMALIPVSPSPMPPNDTFD